MLALASLDLNCTSRSFMLRSLQLTRLAALALLAAIAGCSGGGDSDSSKPPTAEPVTNAGTLSLGAATYSATQSAGKIDLTVNRTAGGEGAVFVSYATVDGTAKANAEYTATTGRLDWAAGDTAAKTITIPLAATSFTGSKDFVVELSGAGGGAVLGTASATVTIQGTATTPPPSSAAVLSLGSATYSANQSAGKVTVTVARTGSTTGAVGVSYTTRDDTAKAGTDYTAKSGTLAFAAGESSKTFDVAITTTPAFTGSKKFNVTISAPTGGASLGGIASSTVTINGGGSASTPGTVAFDSSTYSVSNTSSTATLVVARTGGASGAASVSYTTVDGTGKAGIDYLAKSGTLTWASGDTAAKTIPVTIITTGTGGKAFSVALSGATGASLATPASATVNITAALACSKNSAVWQTCNNWDAKTYGKYWVRNNIWGQGSPGAGSQCMWASSESCWGVTATHSNGNGIPKGYPQTVRGWVQGNGFTVPNSGMGIKVTDLTKAKVHWTMSAPTGGRYMALWDIYLHNKANPAGGDTPRTSLMINQRIADDGYYAGEVANCPQTPGNPCPTVTWGGQTFKLWVGKADWASGNVIQLFLTPTSGPLFGSESMTLDLKAVIDGLRGMGYIPNDDYLTSIQIGWEIVDGGEFQVTKYWTALQDEPDPQ